MKRRNGESLQNDDYARVPFSIIAILLILMTVFSIAIQRDIQEAAIEVRISQLEIELVEELAESNQLVISTTAETTAMRLLEQHEWTSSSLEETEKEFTTQMESILFAVYSKDEPLNLEGYTIYLVEDSTVFHLDRLTLTTSEYDSVSTSGGDFDKQRNEQSVPYGYRVVGETTMVIISPGEVSTFERRMNFDIIIDVPAPLAEDRMTILAGKLSDSESGLARIVKDVLTSLAQQRALSGWGAYEADPANPIGGDWSSFQHADNLITENDIELAISLGLVLLTAREFRTVDMPALASIHPDLPSIVSDYMEQNSGGVQPARVAMVLHDMIPKADGTGVDSFDFDAMLERIIRTISDYYVEILFEAFFRGFEGIAEAVEGADGPSLWESFLSGLSGQDHNSNVFQEFSRNAYVYADENHAVLDSSELFTQKGLDLSPHLYLLADGDPSKSDTTTLQSGVSTNYDDTSRVWYKDVGNCGYYSNGDYYHRDEWQGMYWRVSVSPSTQYPVKFAVIDAFDVADDGVWKPNADSFVDSLVSSDGTSSIQTDFADVFNQFVNKLTQDLATGNSGPVYSYSDFSQHPINITLMNFEERTTALVNLLTGSSGELYLRNNLVQPLFDLVVEFFTQVTDFFTADNYDSLTGWYTDDGNGGILDWLAGLFGFGASSHKDSVRDNAANHLRDTSSVSSEEIGSELCRSSPPGPTSGANWVDDAKSEMRDNTNWESLLDSGIDLAYESLKNDDLQRLQALSGLWQPQPTWSDSPIGGQMTGLVIVSSSGSAGFGAVDGERTFIDLVLASAEHLVETIEGGFEDSNLMQEVAIHQDPFVFWAGDQTAAEENLTTRTTAFRLTSSAGLPTMTIVSYDEDNPSSNIESQIGTRRQQTEGDGTEVFYGFLSEASGTHVANLTNNDIDGAYRTDFNLTVIGRKLISVETIENVLRTATGNEALRFDQMVNIDFTISISVVTGWALFDPADSTKLLDGHELVDDPNYIESSITDSSLWDKIKTVYGWVKDLLDLLIELVLNPSGAIMRIAGEVLKLFVQTLVIKFGELIAESLGSLLTSSMQKWSDTSLPDLTDFQTFSIFGFTWQWCYPGFEDINQDAVPGSLLSSGDWCQKEVLDEPVEVHIRISHKPLFGGTGFQGLAKGTSMSLFVVEAPNIPDQDYTIIANLTRVTDDSYLGVNVDPLRVRMEDHALEMNYYSDETWRAGEATNDGFHLEIHAPHEHPGDFLRVSTRDFGVPLEINLGTKRVGIEAGFEVRYDSAVFTSSRDTIRGIFDDAVREALSFVGPTVDNRAEAEQFLRVFINQVVREVSEWLQEGVHEITFFLEGYFGAAFSSGRTGIRLSFTAENGAVDAVLQWVADSVSYYLGQIGEGQSSNPTFPTDIVDDLWLSVGVLTGTNNNFLIIEAGCDIPTCRSLVDSEAMVGEKHGRFRFLNLEDGSDGWDEEVFGYGTLTSPLSPTAASAVVGV